MTKLRKPLLSVLAVYCLCFLFRFIEYFMIRTDQTFWGEAFLHKLAGIGILCIAVKMFSSSLEFIGFARKGILRHVSMGLLFGAAVFVLAYGVEILLAVSRGGFQSLQLYVSSYTVDGNVGNRTEAVFFLICIAGNILNVVMEEGVFRGLFQKMLQQRYTFIASAVIAAVLFG